MFQIRLAHISSFRDIICEKSRMYLRHLHMEASMTARTLLARVYEAKDQYTSVEDKLLMAV